MPPSRDNLDLAISLILPQAALTPGLAENLASWQRHLRAGDQVLLICQDASALAQAREAAAASELAGLDLRVLGQEPGQAGAAAGPAGLLGLGVAQARGEVILFSQPGCQPAPELLSNLRQAFADPDLAGLAGEVRPRAGQDDWAALAGLELTWRSQEAILPSPQCLALRRRTLLDCGGLEPAWGLVGSLWEAWLRLAGQEQEMAHDPQCQVLEPQPDTWTALLARARQEGRDMFLARRLGISQALLRDQAAVQSVLWWLALGLLIALWGPAPDRAWSLAAICLLLLYPLNRNFLRLVATERPQALGKTLLYCLSRPLAWTAGLLGAALGRLGGR